MFADCRIISRKPYMRTAGAIITIGLVKPSMRCVRMWMKRFRSRGSCMVKMPLTVTGNSGNTDDLTGMAVFLASSEADYIVAQTYNVDGGNWMS